MQIGGKEYKVGQRIRIIVGTALQVWNGRGL